MSLTASSIATTNTLEQLRTEFNNLVTDVTGLEAGTKTFSAVTSNTSNTTTLNVLEDGTIIFEGATDDGNETTLTVVDPTADRTITFPNASGTVIISDSSTNVTTLPDDLLIKDGGTIGNASVEDVMTLASTGIVTFKDDLVIKDGGTIGVSSAATAITIASTGIVTFVDDIIIKDAGTIGSASDTDAISISSGGVVNISATTANTSASDGALTVAGGAGIAADLSVGDDLRLISDSAVLSFGADSDTTLTHTDGSGLTLNSTNKLMFNDATQFIQGASGTVLDIAATDEIELTATLIDVVGNLAGSGTGTFGGILKTDDTTEATSTTDGSLQTDGGLSVAKDIVAGDDVKLLSDSAVLSFGADSDTTLTHTDGSGLTINSTNKIMFRDSALFINSSTDGQLDIDADTEVEITATTIDINGAVEISGTTTQTGISTSAAKDIFNASLSVKNGSTSAGFIEFFEDSDNGTNKVTLIGPASTSDVTLTLGTATGTIATTDDATALAIALG